MISTIASWRHVCPASQSRSAAGIGNLKRRLPERGCDRHPIRPVARLRRRCPASCRSQDGAASNIVMVDVLHHIEFPGMFFREASRALRPGGRLIMVEPAITWGSTLFFRLLHHEPVRHVGRSARRGRARSAARPLRLQPGHSDADRHKRARAFSPDVSSLGISKVDWFSLAVYPLTGGFKPWSLISARMAEAPSNLSATGARHRAGLQRFA